MNRHKQYEIALILALCVTAIAIGIAWATQRDLERAEARAQRLYQERDVWIGNYQRLKEDR